MSKTATISPRNMGSTLRLKTSDFQTVVSRRLSLKPPWAGEFASPRRNRLEQLARKMWRISGYGLPEQINDGKRSSGLSDPVTNSERRSQSVCAEVRPGIGFRNHSASSSRGEQS